MIHLDGIMVRSDQYLIYGNVMDRWTPLLWDLTVEKAEMQTGSTFENFPQVHTHTHTHKKLLAQIQENRIFQRGRCNNTANKYNFHTLTGHEFSVSNPSWATTDGRWSLKSLRPFVWLSLSISVSIHPSPSFSTPVSFCPSLSASFSLHKFSRLSQERSLLISMHTSFPCSSMDCSLHL